MKGHTEGTALPLSNKWPTKESNEKPMHDIDKPITLEDLTNPDKN